MSKNTKPAGLSWDEAPQAKIKMVLQMAQSNRYSASRIYAAHNAVFGLNEAVQMCSTCLSSRERALRKWWVANAPKDEPTATTGEEQEAVTYDGVIAKYKFHTGGDTELATLNTAIEAGAAPQREGWAKGITEGELALLIERRDELQAASDKAASDKAASDKAASDKAASDKAAPAHTVLDFGENTMAMHFIPSEDDDTKGDVINEDGSKVKAGTYEAADGTKIAVQPNGKASIK